MKCLVAFLLLAGAAACDRKPDPMARTDDIWPGARRAAATSMPNAVDIERICQEASVHWQRDIESRGGIVDPSYYEYPVRNPVCRPEPGSPSTLNCRFEQATIYHEMPTEAQRKEALARMKGADWKPSAARLVFVSGAGWIAPAGCQPIPVPSASQ
jgi:hypothetical protein